MKRAKIVKILIPGFVIALIVGVYFIKQSQSGSDALASNSEVQDTERLPSEKVTAEQRLAGIDLKLSVAEVGIVYVTS